MDREIKINAGTVWIFDYDNKEFERVRELCLSDKNNWLRDNYTKENLKISDHIFYCVLYGHDGNPIIMTGVKEYNKDVLRYCNRHYTFPNTRKYQAKPPMFSKELMDGFSDFLKFTLENVDHKLIFISMQQRNKRAKQQLWWKAIVKLMSEFHNIEWINYDKGLVQVANCEETSCYQNMMYYTRGDYKFEDWNPKVMSYDEHALRMDYETRLQHRL